MKRTVTAIEARRRLGELLESVYLRGDEVVIERAGKPMAVVIPAERYKRLEESRARLFEMIDEVHDRNRDVPLADITKEIDEAVREVRNARVQT